MLTDRDSTPNKRILFSSVADCIYTSCYCEENVWQLCKTIKERHKEELPTCYCVFISNSDRTIPLWCQKASKREDGLVIWDYHVIFIHKKDNVNSQVYDLDTQLDFPCDLTTYTENGIKSCMTLKPQLQRNFRVIPAGQFLETFASDRSHMMNEKEEWLKPPPSYPCIQTHTSTNNIQEFINMDSTVGVGTVMKYGEFLAFFTS